MQNLEFFFLQFSVLMKPTEQKKLNQGESNDKDQSINYTSSVDTLMLFFGG